MVGSGEEGLEFPILVGDIGGTNARFAVVVDPTTPAIEFPWVKTEAYNFADGGEAAIRATVFDGSDLRPKSIVLAVAGPVNSDEIPLTNCPWVIKPKRLIEALGFRHVIVLNDFEAQALAVVALGKEDMEQIGGGAPEENAPRVVLGPGTGLGVAGLIHLDGRWLPLPGEGGHMDIGPRSARDFQVFPNLEAIEGRISGEQILCGRGLVNIYNAVSRASGLAPRFTDPSQITAAALARNDAVSEETVSLFATCLGRTAGDVALVFMSRGGVFLTGGIAQKIVPALKTGNFRAAFEDKAPHSALMGTIPVYVMTEPKAALRGLQAYAQTPERFRVQTKGRHWR